MKKQLAYIILSILLLSISIKKFEYLSISICLFLLLSYTLSDLVLNHLNQRKQKNKKYINMEWIGIIGVLLSLYPSYYFENTIGGYKLFWISAFCSLLLNIFLVICLNIFIDFTNEKKFYNLLSLCMFSFAIFSALPVFINAKFSNDSPKIQTLEINRKYLNKSAKGSIEYEIFIKTQYDADERLKIDKELYEEISNKDIVKITSEKGILGFDYVTKIEKK